MKPSPKTKEAISEATGTRDKQIQQHLLQEPQHAENEKKNVTTNPRKQQQRAWLSYYQLIERIFERTVKKFGQRYCSWSTKANANDRNIMVSPLDAERHTGHDHAFSIPFNPLQLARLAPTRNC